MTILVTGGIKLRECLWRKEWWESLEISLTWDKHLMYSLVSDPQHQSVVGQDLCVAIGHLPLFREGFCGYLL